MKLRPSFPSANGSEKHNGLLLPFPYHKPLSDTNEWPLGGGGGIKVSLRYT